MRFKKLNQYMGLQRLANQFGLTWGLQMLNQFGLTRVKN